MSKKYKPGMLLGPNKVLYVDTVPREEWPQKYCELGVFKCPKCGKNFKARLANVVSGNTKNCNRHRAENMARIMSKDIAGERFGKLTAIKWTGKCQNTNRVWLCRCDCGRYREVNLNVLRNGYVKSCKYCVEHSYKDLLGQKFGKLTPIEKTNKRIDGRVVWKCKCDCGNIAYVTSHHLLNGDTRSCGCVGKSFGEWIIVKFLSEINIPFLQEYKFEKCINPNTQKHLRFDFYLPDYNCCIEYDGRQHFFSKNSGWDTVENTKRIQERDKIKNKFCIDNNIILIRVPYYYQTEKEIIDFLEKEFEKNAISF